MESNKNGVGTPRLRKSSVPRKILGKTKEGGGETEWSLCLLGWGAEIDHKMEANNVIP